MSNNVRSAQYQDVSLFRGTTSELIHSQFHSKYNQKCIFVQFNNNLDCRMRQILNHSSTTPCYCSSNPSQPVSKRACLNSSIAATYALGDWARLGLPRGSAFALSLGRLNISMYSNQSWWNTHRPESWSSCRIVGRILSAFVNSWNLFNSSRCSWKMGSYASCVNAIFVRVPSAHSSMQFSI